MFKFIKQPYLYFLLIILPVYAHGQTTTLADNGSQVSAANVAAGTTDHILAQFTLTSTGSPNVTQVTCVTAGTYLTADVANMKLRYSTDAVLSAGDATLATLASPGGPGTKTLNGFSQALTASTTRYFFITIDITTAATSGRTINVNAMGTGNFTVTGTKAGSTTAGGAQTIIVPSITIGDNGTQIGAANVAKGSTDYVIHKFVIGVTTADAMLTGMQCSTTGTSYQPTDITNLKVRYSTDATLDAGDATLSTYPSPAIAGTLTFPSFSSQLITNGSTGYIFITADIAAGAVTSRTIVVNSITTAHLTFTTGAKSGSSTGAGTQTIFVPNITIADNGTQVAAANVDQGTSSHVIHKFSLTAVSTVNLTAMQCVTTGSYAAADISNLKVRYSTDATLDAGDATLSTYTNPGAAGTKTFPSFTSQSITGGTTRYIFITADIYAGAGVGNTISVNGITSSDLTFSSGTKGANSSASGAQTFTGTSFSNIYTVTTTTDAVAGSLREAVGFANASAGHDLIVFNLGGAGPYTLTLGSTLLIQTDNSGVTINGWSNTGNNGTPNSNVIFSSGINATYKIILTGAADPLVSITSNNNVMKGLVFGDAASAGKIISISGNTNEISGCYIGMSSTGTTRTATNATYGIYITGATNTIGDGTAAGANLISGMSNYGYGIYITGAATANNTIKGNIIGLQKDGATMVTSHRQLYGVCITSTASFNNTIGGTGAEDGNVISGHYGQYSTGTKYAGAGILLSGTAAAGNNVYGNRIGTQCNGMYPVASNTQYYGILVSNSRNNNIGGNTSAHRNVISGNGPIPFVSPFNMSCGIAVIGASSTGNSIRGNYIGPTADGTSFLRDAAGTTYAEQFKGIRFNSAGANNSVGGSGAGDGNVISGNRCHFDPSSNCGEGRGIMIFNTDGVNIQGNIIGLQADGNTILANAPTEKQYRGIEIDSSSNNTVIGGSTASARNIISGNSSTGITISAIYYSSSLSTGTLIKGNYIGLQSDGNTQVASNTQAYGVDIDNVTSTTIGGTAAGEGNVISGNNVVGVNLGGNSNTVIRNIIGPQSDGISFVTGSSQGRGIDITAANNIIGSSIAADRNIISGNATYGIYLRDAGATGNTIKGNYIGPGSGLAAIAGASQGTGIYIYNGASNNTIGGTAANEPNMIAYNTGIGVEVYLTSSTGNKITRNPIYGNPSKPINLNYGANQGNNGKAVPAITTVSTTTVVGTAGAFDVVEVFKNSTGTAYDAFTYLGTATADGSGNWSLAATIAAGERVLADATDGSNNTSEFSVPTSPLPVNLLFFSAECNGQGKVVCRWITASESNNDFFTIEKTNSPGGEWQMAGTLQGAGNSSTIRQYEFTDRAVQVRSQEAPLFYRLKQTDYNGQYVYYNPVALSCEENSDALDVFPNPASGDVINVSLKSKAGNEILLLLNDVAGKESYLKTVITEQENNIYTLELQQKLTPGIYFIRAASEDQVLSKKIVVR